MMKYIIGTCSNCGGNVMKESFMDGYTQIFCTKCGATKRPKLPVIEMQESKNKPKLLLD